MLPYAESTTMVTVPQALRETKPIKIEKSKYLDMGDNIINIELYPLYVVVKVSRCNVIQELYLPNFLPTLEEDINIIKASYERNPDITWKNIKCCSTNFHYNFVKYNTFVEIGIIDKTIIKAMEIVIQMLDDRIKYCSEFYNRDKKRAHYQHLIDCEKRKGLFDFGLTDLNIKLSRDLFEGALDEEILGLLNKNEKKGKNK